VAIGYLADEAQSTDCGRSIEEVLPVDIEINEQASLSNANKGFGLESESFVPTR